MLSSLYLFSFEISRNFYIALNSYNNPPEARISILILKKKNWGFIVKYCQRLGLNTEVFTTHGFNKGLLMEDLLHVSKDSPGHLEHSEEYNTILFSL